MGCEGFVDDDDDDGVPAHLVQFCRSSLWLVIDWEYGKWQVLQETVLFTG